MGERLRRLRRGFELMFDQTYSQLFNEKPHVIP